MVSQNQPILYRTCIFVLIFCTNFLTASEKCETANNLYVIRSNGPNGLVLDATEPDQVRVQHFTGSEAQLWRFESSGRPGSYYIINEYHRKVLDFVEQHDGFLHVIVNDKQNCMQQEWNFGIDGQIVNRAVDWNVDIHRANYAPGTQVIVWEEGGCQCQRFLLQKKV